MNGVLEQMPITAALGTFDVGLRGYAVDNDQYCAVRQAFASLRDAVAAAVPPE